MKVTRQKHFDYLTPFEEAENDRELEEITRLKYPKACSNLEVDAGFFARMVEDVKKFKAWRVVGFSSFEDFCQAKLGKTLDEVSEIVSGVRVLRDRGVQKVTRAEAVKAAAEQPATLSPTGRPKKGKETLPLSSKGPTVQRLTARIARDHPQILSRMKAGEFKSVRAAAIEAGIVKAPTPLDILKRAWVKANKRQRQEFLAWSEGHE